jgi:hypothetical protein
LRATAANIALFGLILAALTVSPEVRATSPYLVSLPDEALAASPAHRYANLSNEEAYAELDSRGVPHRKEVAVEGVRAPVRLTGPLHGVDVHSALPAEKRAGSHFEILDARLALALDDLCAVLERHEIVELVHYTMYRPNGLSPEEQTATAKRSGKRSGDESTKKRARRRSSADKSSSKRTSKTRKGSLGKGKAAGKQRASSEPRTRKQKSSKTRTKGSAPSSKKSASQKSASRKSASNKSAARKSVSQKSTSKSSKRKRARRRGRKPDPKLEKSLYAPPGTRHPAGLAIDVGGFRKRDGRWLSVANHFKGRLGAQTCGARVEPPNTPEARELWSIVCEAYDLGLFTYVLTPNYDRAHADHFHMEIRGDVRWVLFH